MEDTISKIAQAKVDEVDVHADLGNYEQFGKLG